MVVGQEQGGEEWLGKSHASPQLDQLQQKWLPILRLFWKWDYGFKCHCQEWPGAQTQTRCFWLNELQARSSIQAESARALCPQQVQGNLSYPHLQGSGLTLTPKRRGLTLQLP